MLEGISIKGAKNILLNVTGSSNLTMQEIDDGNKVIYDAAGEEANVIFGWVNKEEMNEYVSYTVIATGFSSETSTLKQTAMAAKVEEKKKEKPNIPLGGYSPKSFEIEDTDNLDVPTIFRVKGASNKMNDDDPSEQTGFKFEQYDAFGKEEVEEEKVNIKEDDDSSSFLRMMMD